MVLSEQKKNSKIYNSELAPLFSGESMTLGEIAQKIYESRRILVPLVAVGVLSLGAYALFRQNRTPSETGPPPTQTGTRSEMSDPVRDFTFLHRTHDGLFRYSCTPSEAQYRTIEEAIENHCVERGFEPSPVGELDGQPAKPDGSYDAFFLGSLSSDLRWKRTEQGVNVSPSFTWGEDRDFVDQDSPLFPSLGEDRMLQYP
jgi:hypothetical protein